jgi:hypothetical protein
MGKKRKILILSSDKLEVYKLKTELTSYKLKCELWKTFTSVGDRQRFVADPSQSAPDFIFCCRSGMIQIRKPGPILKLSRVMSNFKFT